MARERRSRSSFWRKDSYLMHATERQRAILTILGKRGFIAFRDLETHIEGSPATLRRTLDAQPERGALLRASGGPTNNTRRAVSAAVPTFRRPFHREHS